MVSGFYGLWKFFRGPGFSVGGQRGWVYTSFCSGNGVTEQTSSGLPYLVLTASAHYCPVKDAREHPARPVLLSFSQAVARSW